QAAPSAFRLSVTRPWQSASATACGSTPSTFCATMSGVAHTGTSTLRGAVNVTWSTAACAGLFENETARRWPVPSWKISTTGLFPDQSVRPTSSASSGDRSGVRSVAPVSLLVHGPGDHGTEAWVGGRLLMSLAVLLNVAALESACATIATVAGSMSVALAVNWT